MKRRYIKYGKLYLKAVYDRDGKAIPEWTDDRNQAWHWSFKVDWLYWSLRDIVFGKFLKKYCWHEEDED